MTKIRVLICDDSAFIRDVFREILSADPEIEVADTAVDPFDAREKIKSLNPDVLTLDIEMPKMDGLTFLEKIMALRPMPVVMVSSLTAQGAEETLRALELGAVDYVLKPTNKPGQQIHEIADELRSKVKAAARSRRTKRTPGTGAAPKLEALPQLPLRLIAIGASTGGVEALKEVLTPLPATLPPIVITQHMPPLFTKSFAERLNKNCNLTIVEGEDGQALQNGHAYIAKGGFHMKVVRAVGSGLSLRIEDGALVSGHKPSVDVLFDSIAALELRHALAIILTGMGKDGARGLLNLQSAGAYTLGQDEASSLVYGMPKAAFLAGAVTRQLPLSQMASAIQQIAGKNHA